MFDTSFPRFRAENAIFRESPLRPPFVQGRFPKVGDSRKMAFLVEKYRTGRPSKMNERWPNYLMIIVATVHPEELY